MYDLNVLQVFKILLEHMPYDPRVYRLYFVNVFFHSMLPMKKETSI